MSLFVREEGPSDAQTIVLLHGGGGAGWMWRPQVEALRDSFHLLVPDLPEQGRSKQAGSFTIESAAEQIAVLIRERAHGGRAHLVGLSEGAQVVVQLLAMEPNLAETAVISSALVRPMAGGTALSSPTVLRWTYRSSVAPFRNVDWWIRWNMRGAAGVPDDYFDDFRESFQGLTEEGFVNLMAANQSFRLPDGLSEVKTRVLVVCGEGEHEVMKLSVRDVADAIPGARAFFVEHPGGASLASQHNWNMTAPETFSAMMRAWIAGGPLPQVLVEQQRQGTAGAEIS